MAKFSALTLQRMRQARPRGGVEARGLLSRPKALLSRILRTTSPKALPGGWSGLAHARRAQHRERSALYG